MAARLFSRLSRRWRRLVIAGVVIAGVVIAAGLAVALPLTLTSGGSASSDRWAELTIAGRDTDCVHVLAPSQYRDGLSGTRAPAHGAWFYWGPSERAGFWMHDTVVPLWIVWVGQEGRWLGEEEMAAESVTVHESPAGAVAAVELLHHVAEASPVLLGSTCRA